MNLPSSINGWERLKTNDIRVDQRIPSNQGSVVAYVNSPTEIMEISTTGGIDLAPKKYHVYHKRGFSYDRLDTFDSKEEALDRLQSHVETL